MTSRHHHQGAAELRQNNHTSYLDQIYQTLSASLSKQCHFADNNVDVVMELEPMEDGMEFSSVNRLSHGSVSLIGRKRVMEDALTVAPPGFPSNCKYEFFAVYDGQGGAWVSVACHEHLHLILASELSSEGTENGVDWIKVMKTSFKKMDDVVKGFLSENVHVLIDDGAVGFETTGSTATVVMVGEKDIAVANCGDSKAVLFSGGVALPLTIDHKPHAPSEQTRLINGGINVQFDLPVTRSIGHHSHILKQYLIAEPDVNMHKRTASDEFLIIATHGLWDVVSTEDACLVVKNCLDGQIKRSFEEVPETSPTVAATTLAEYAIARGSKDNISLVVVVL